VRVRELRGALFASVRKPWLAESVPNTKVQEEWSCAPHVLDVEKQIGYVLSHSCEKHSEMDIHAVKDETDMERDR
jgi:hypothetical protein